MDGREIEKRRDTSGVIWGALKYSHLGQLSLSTTATLGTDEGGRKL